MIILILNYILLMSKATLRVAFLTLFERKVSSYIRDRKGPDQLLFKGNRNKFDTRCVKMYE